jgi:hypothetical membrane protein
MISQLARLAAVAPPLFATLTVLAGLVKPGYDVREQTVSDLAVGAHGWIQNLNFVLLGAGMVAFALALAIAPKPRRRMWAAVVLLAAAGVGVGAEALFPTDLAGAPETPDGVAHNMIFLLVFLALIAAMALQRARLAAATTFAGLVVFVMFAGDVGDPLHGVAGLLERAIIAIPLAWITITARGLDPRPARLPVRRPATVVAAAAAVLLLGLAIAGQAHAQARVLYVDPVSGADANPGSSAQPLKTLGKALSASAAGTTIKLAGGGYGPTANGETFPAGGLRVPAGVTIDGATENGVPVTTLVGSGHGVALNLDGNATVRDVFLGGAGFGVGVFADQGTQVLGNLFVVAAGKSAAIDGTTLIGGIVLRGSARASLTGGRLFANGGVGASLLEQARLTLRGGQINANATTGVAAHQQAQLTIDGSRIIGSNAGCATGSGVVLHDKAQAILKNQVELAHLASALTANQDSTAVLSGTRVAKDSSAGCVETPSVSADGSASVTLDGARVSATGGQTVGLEASGAALLALRDTEVRGHTRAGLNLSGSPTIGIDGGSITNNAIGVRKRVTGLPRITVTRARLAQNDIAMQVGESILKVRNSQIVLNRIGIEARGSVGGLPTRDEATACAGACVNLGTDRALPGPTPFDDPGGNTFAANTETGLDLTFASGHVPAIGNVWNTGTQGADALGRYPGPFDLDGTSPLAKGANFRLTPFTQVSLGPSATVGSVRLAPRRLTARAGHRARLKLAWTHPVAWKRLDRVALRLGAAARIAIHPRSEGVSVRGGVRVAAARVSHRGKTVTARLTIRIGGRYAGRTLRVQASAVDRAGRRQTVPAAGAIRVLR